MEFMNIVAELQAVPTEVHILCPRQHDDDYGRYEDESEPNDSGKSVTDLVVEAKTRREKFLSCMRILAYSEEEVEDIQKWIWRKIDDTLEKCDLCIKHYYMGKIWLVEHLKENYDDEDIEKFSRMLDEWDIKRITRNLATATVKLKEVPPEQIGLHVLDRASLLSIFETLSCEAMLRSDSLLTEHFDEPFRLIQTKRTLKVSDYIPAVIRFLFDSNQNRSFWAIHSWMRYQRPPTTAEFDWAIKEGLLDALRTASQQPTQLAIIQRLWRGMQLVVKRLDKEQVTHNLRALEIDPCRLSVEHLAIQSPGLRFTLNTIQIFLEKAPGDFWDAMQTISPQAIVELVFYNPQLDAFLMQATEGEPYEKSAMKDMLSWVGPFMLSLKGAHQPTACRSLVYQLIDRLQDARFPNLARYHCFHVGLVSLLQTLRSFTDHESSRGSVGRVVLSETLGVLTKYIRTLLNPPQFAVEEGRQHDIKSLCMDVIRNTLALECQSLKSDYEVILKHNSLQHGVSTYSSAIWDAVILHLHEDNLGLSKSALLGILPLVGLEKFPTRGGASPEKTHFNTIYGHLTHISCQIIERLADFKPEHLDDLFKSQDTGSALISALFAADHNTYQAAVDLIKNVSGQSARRDAISHLLQSFFTTTMYGLSWSFRRISNMKTFASAPRMIHTGTDIVDILCDSQTGMLRTRKLADRKEALSLQRLWEFLWQALTTIFDQTESWHQRGNDKSVMLEFCRDSIQFADLLFSQYGVFLSAVVDADPTQEAAARENFIKSPTSTMSGMVKWLRLKDEYLATTLVGLVSRILRRLGELSVTTVKDDALSTIEGVAVKSTIKTILTPREKAELVRALEAYYKKPVVTASTASLKKQSTITAFTKPVESSVSPSPSRATDEFEESDVADDVLLQLSRSVELNKERIAAIDAKKRADRPVSKALLSIPKPTPASLKPNFSVQSFRERREKEKEAKKKRDLAELARLKRGAPALGVAEQTAQQGSAILGLGVKGKDHSPADSMMVSSGSESESESEDELDRELFGSRGTSKPDAVKAYEDSKKKSLKIQGPVKKIKQVRSAKDMRARLAPDLSTLHRTILAWDFFAGGDLPPNSGRTDYSLVSNAFRDPIEYQRTFEPLLILEAWQGFQSAKEEGSFRTFEIKVATRLSVDSFIEVSTVLPGSEVKDLGIGEADIVLLSKANSPATNSSAPHCLARVASINRKKGNVEISYRVNPGSAFINSLSPGTTIWGAKITSLTPLEREFGALMALQYYDLCEEIIKAKPSPILNYSDASLKPIADNYNVNPAQAKAIKSAMDNDAFTLIQGPPGSGKTKTIVALVGALLTNSLGADQGVSVTRPTAGGRPPARATTSKKLLVCAPSNAAVDELVMRFKEGVRTIHGRNEKLSVIRLGRSDAINTNVLDVTLDELVNARLSGSSRKEGEVDLQKIYMEHKAADTAFKEIRSKMDQCRAQGLPVPQELEREFDLLKKTKTQLSQQIDNARDKNHSAARDADLNRRRIQQEIINGAHVICATLSGSGHEMFQNLSIEFETVVIDEAAQSIELSALIPLKYGCSKCILVGDPKQLPPTVLSKVASKYQYEQSLFVRMQANHPRDVHLLDIQYRMHPEISMFPRTAFYDGRLQDGPDMVKLRARPWHNSELLSPYRFFDVQGMSQSSARHSLVNIAELEVAMQLYERLLTDFREYDFSRKIGIITPYKGQLRELKSRFASKYGNAIFNMIDFNTTDAFQGRESEVIIFSCVRASNRGIGFLSDIRRMNVGLTRAKSSLWVLGNSQSLVQGEFWNGLIKDARRRNVYTDGEILKILRKPQFTGYKNVEMADADAPEPPMPSRSASASATSVPRPSSASTATLLSESSLPASASGNEAQLGQQTLPSGPSGGPNGLDDRRNCGICGSFAHMTHNCDNEESKEMARGTCFRCGEAGHTKFNCNAERCTECGQTGHAANSCQSTTVLSKQEKKQIARQELMHSRNMKERAEKQRQRQLGGHDPKVPVIQVSTDTPKGEKHDGPGKRKRTDSPASDGSKASRPRTSDQNMPPAPENAPTGPKNQRRKIDANVPPPSSENLVKPSRDGPAYAPINSNNKTMGGPQGSSGPANPHRPPNRPGNGPRPPPPIRKKKDADPFIRPKRR